MELAGRLLRGPGRAGAGRGRCARPSLRLARCGGPAPAACGSSRPRYVARPRVSPGPGPGAAGRGALRCPVDAAACPGRWRAAAPGVLHLPGHRGQVQPGGRWG